LKNAKEIAESANLAKTKFLASVSHEIRTPMNAIIGMVDLTLESELNNAQKENLLTVKESAEFLMSILNDLLDLSKIESGRIELEKIEFALRATIDTACKGFAFKAISKGIGFTVDIANDVPDNIIGDPGRLRQVILNLVSNAV